MQAEQQSERERFEAWAKDKGYDTAGTYDTERSRWVWLNPMTADLWEAWRAALSHQSTPQESKPGQETAPEVTSSSKEDADRSDREAELRQDNAMLRDALRKLLADPVDAEHVQYAWGALGEHQHG